MGGDLNTDDGTGLFQISSDLIICFIPHNLESQSELEEYIDNILTGSDKQNEYECENDEYDDDYEIGVDDDDDDINRDDVDEKGDNDED